MCAARRRSCTARDDARGHLPRGRRHRAAFRASQDYDLWLRLPLGAGLANPPSRSTGGARTRAAACPRDEQLWSGHLRRRSRSSARTRYDSLAEFERAASREPYLAPGTYRLTVEAPGFKRYVREGRGREARAFLARARRSGDTRAAALGWQALSYAIALTPRAARARAQGGKR